MTRIIADDRLKIEAHVESGSGATRYEIRGFDGSANRAWDGLNQHSITLTLQDGPLSAGKAPNGLTVNALLAIVVDQLRSFNASPQVNGETVDALAHANIVMTLLKSRTEA